MPAVRIVARDLRNLSVQCGTVGHPPPFRTRKARAPSLRRQHRLGISRRVLRRSRRCRHFRYDAAAFAPRPWSIVDEEIEMLGIPACRYAPHRLAGPSARFSKAINALCGRWLPSSGHEPDDRLTLEHDLTRCALSPRATCAPLDAWRRPP
ncbi:GyrI-like domain-containing protein [Variovorax sp. J31P207]|uniref:GyrI-like domain-containing protein n=1 Tax=Variovorax sp. J31P207 TaxID=3053510 RepID=UPI003365861D